MGDAMNYPIREDEIHRTHDERAKLKPEAVLTSQVTDTVNVRRRA